MAHIPAGSNDMLWSFVTFFVGNLTVRLLPPTSHQQKCSASPLSPSGKEAGPWVS